jgi:NAD(P)-dependent dehydrogenase (short-subunit alcohol dehydrogenase family)
MTDLSARVVLVTGAAGALGQAVAAAYAEAGARLALVDIAGERLRELYGEDTEDRRLYAADITDAQAVAALVGQVVDQFGGLQVLANIAGGFAMGPPVQDTDTATWDRMMDLNARSVFNLCRAAIPHMLDGGWGRVVNVSARAVERGKGRMGPYCASKAAVLTLTESVAAENWHTPVNVNCILPGTIDTPQNRADMPDADHAKWVAPADLAAVVLFLSSEAARAVNGAAVPVYGQS